MSHQSPTKQSQRLSLHHLLVALSFWGSATRIFLIGFIVFALSLVTVLGAQAGVGFSISATLTDEIQRFVYVVGSFFILDVGYVLVARRYPLRILYDRLILLVAEFALALGYVLPHVAFVPSYVSALTQWLLLAALMVVALRLTLGIVRARE